MTRRIWFSRRAIGLHAVILVVVPLFAAMCIWQVDRALGGNDLSWAYVFEWPFFAGYAIYMWWRLLHEVPVDAGLPYTRSDPLPGGSPAGTDSSAEAAERAAYNRYLAELAARGKRKQWR